jgi:hypothetical protein
MTYEDLVNIFKNAANAYTGTPSLNFHYDAVWYNNGAASNQYPSMLFERSPDFELVGQQSNGRTGKQTFKGKLFFYDTFWEGERAVKDVYVKQSELNELALKVLGNINQQTQALPTQRIDWGSGFFGVDVHNPKLVQVFIPFTATIKSECTPLNP